jgi:hypothetical protein
VQIVYGAGVATPGGVLNRVEKRFAFTVREPFTVSFNCERENAQAACMPIRPMRLTFNAPVARKLAEAIRLKSPATPSSRCSTRSRRRRAGQRLRFKPRCRRSTASRSNCRPASRTPAAARSNAASFPLKVATGVMPPLAKFAAAPFGIVERFAEPDAKGDTPALLPVTLRNVEPALKISGLTPGGKVSDLQPKTDADIIAWFRKVQRYNDFTVPRARPRPTSRARCRARWTPMNATRCSRAWCRCWRASRREDAGPAQAGRPKPSRRHEVAHAPSRSWAFRWPPASTWSRSPRRCWVPRCSTSATARRARWSCAPRPW